MAKDNVVIQVIWMLTLVWILGTASVTVLMMLTPVSRSSLFSFAALSVALAFCSAFSLEKAVKS